MSAWSRSPMGSPRWSMVATLCFVLLYDVGYFLLVVPRVPAGELLWFLLAVLPAALASLVALAFLGVTARRVVSGTELWWLLLVSFVLMLTTVFVSAMSFYFFLFAMIQFV